MVDSASQDPKYTEFEQKHNRHLNMLSEADRNLRRQALVEFNKVIDSSAISDEHMAFFYRERLVRRLVLTLEDQIEKNRELAIEIITKAIERVGLKDEAGILLPAIANRMNKQTFSESSEEVRVELIELLSTCLESDKIQFLGQLGPVCGMLARAAQDSNPEMKQKVASFAGELSSELKDKAGPYMKGCIASLTQNLAHQHSKVRKSTLRGLKEVVVARGAETYIIDSVPQLKFVMNDRSQDVRTTFYDVLCYWMTNMELEGLRAAEGHFILMLLNGLSDESEQVRVKCQTFLEEHGKRMKDVLAAIGDDDEDNEDETMEN